MLPIPSHRALNMPDILHGIFLALGPVTPMRTCFPEKDSSDSGRNSLANAAVCCRAFSNPALDALWRVMDSIIPLFSVLPAFQNKTFAGAIEPMHWTRFQQNARRIRHLKCNDAPIIDKFVCIRITQLLKGEPLLPLLDSLEHPLDPDMLLFISPTLRDLNIKTTGKTEELLQCFLHAVADTALLLRTFHIRGDTLAQSCAKLLTQFQSLTCITLRLTSIDAHAIPIILELQNLEILTLNVEEPISIPQSAAPTQLRSLRALSIKGTPLSIRDILDRIASHRLEKLEIEQIWPLDEDESIHPEDYWKIHLERIRRWSQTLSFLTLTDDWSEADISTQRPLPHTPLDDLYHLRNLKHLSTSLAFNVYLSYLPDRMIASWPKMETLHIQQPEEQYDEGDYFSFPTVQMIATSWPSLRSLMLPLDILPTSGLPFSFGDA